MPPPDVFLSYNSRDRAAVVALACALREKGLQPWLDRWEIPKGGLWQPMTEHAAASAKAVAVCFGPAGLGPWQAEEVRVALEAAVRDSARQVHPVLLPGSPGPEALPPFLRQRLATDLRAAWDPEVDGFARALRGLAPASAAPPSTERPYRGLESFTEADAAWMFGREAEVTTLLERLKGGRLLVVVGASGSGKSSLVRAGLVPAVRAGDLDGSLDWWAAVLRPTTRPVYELALRLAEPPGTTASVAAAVTEVAALHALLLARPTELAPTVDVALARFGRGRPARLLLIVDQLEELFTVSAADERAAFLAALLHATEVAGGRLHVVATVRADFLQRCLAEPALAHRMPAAAQIVLPPMSAPQLRDAVRRPALAVGVRIEDAVVDVLVSATVDSPGSLPLLQHTLSELWARRDPAGHVGWAAYVDVGGIEGAIARSAEALLTRTPASEDVFRRVFGRLVVPGLGTGDTRRRAARSEFTAEAAVALDALVEARLVTAHDGHVEIAHEALVREWTRLQAWVDADREALRLRMELGEAAKRGDEPWRGARLARAEETFPKGDPRLSEAEAAFLAAGLDARAAERAAEEKRQYDELMQAVDLADAQAARVRTTRIALAGVSTLLAVSIALTTIAANLWVDSVQSTLTTQAVGMARLAEVQGDDPLVALLLALESVERAWTPEGSAILADATAATGFFATIPLAGGAEMEWSPDGRRLLVKSEGTGKLLVVSSDGPVLLPPTPYADDLAPVWSADGAWLLTAEAAGLRVRSAETGEVVADLPTPTPCVAAMGWMPDQGIWASGCSPWAGPSVGWRLTTWRRSAAGWGAAEAFAATTSAEPPEALAWAPSGTRVAAIWDEGGTWILDAHGREQVDVPGDCEESRVAWPEAGRIVLACPERGYAVLAAASEVGPWAPVDTSSALAQALVTPTHDDEDLSAWFLDLTVPRGSGPLRGSGTGRVRLVSRDGWWEAAQAFGDSFIASVYEVSTDGTAALGHANAAGPAVYRAGNARPGALVDRLAPVALTRHGEGYRATLSPSGDRIAVLARGDRSRVLLYRTDAWAAETESSSAVIGSTTRGGLEVRGGWDRLTASDAAGVNLHTLASHGHGDWREPMWRPAAGAPLPEDVDFAPPTPLGDDTFLVQRSRTPHVPCTWHDDPLMTAAGQPYCDGEPTHELLIWEPKPGRLTPAGLPRECEAEGQSTVRGARVLAWTGTLQDGFETVVCDIGVGIVTRWPGPRQPFIGEWSLSPDGKRAAGVLARGEARVPVLWDIAAGSTVVLPVAPPTGGEASTPHWTPDGRAVVVTGPQGITWFSLDGVAVASSSLGASGYRELADGSATNGTMLVRASPIEDWTLYDSAGTAVGTLPATCAGAGEIVACPVPGEVRLHATADATLVAHFPVPVTSDTALLSPDATHVLTTGLDGAVRVWRVSDGVEVSTFQPRPSGTRAEAAWTPDSLHVRIHWNGLGASDGGDTDRVYPATREALLALARTHAIRTLTDEERARFVPPLPYPGWAAFLFD